MTVPLRRYCQIALVSLAIIAIACSSSQDAPVDSTGDTEDATTDASHSPDTRSGTAPEAAMESAAEMQPDRFDAPSCSTLPGACEQAGRRLCHDDSSVVTCESQGDCFVWGSPISCGDQPCVDGECLPCSGVAGTFRQQVLSSGGEDRTYFLYVPTTYHCDQPAPVLFDFHGAYGASLPEEAYILDEAVAEAEAAGVILVRPRARPSAMNMWDATAQDIPLNIAFTIDLLTHLKSVYRIDSANAWAFGYSSGSNMAGQFLSRADNPFTGIGFVAGGLWTIGMTSVPDLTSSSLRVYLNTGFRDLHRIYADRTLDALRSHGIPNDQLFERQADAGHALLNWHYRDMIGFFSAGTKPEAGSASTPWMVEPPPTSGETFLEVAQSPDGHLVASGAHGTVYQQTAPGSEWEVALPALIDRPLGGLCVDQASGIGVATGLTHVARRTASTEAWSMSSVPPSSLGYTLLWAAACDDATQHLGGTSDFLSADQGSSWTEASTQWTTQGYLPQSIAVSPSGTKMWAGRYGYIARQDASTTVLVSCPRGEIWLDDVAWGPAGTWGVVGEKGAVLWSTDDGQHFSDRTPPGLDADLYAISIRDEQVAAIGGAHGAVWITLDGATTWEDISIGRDMLVADVLVSSTDVLVVGEAGMIARRALSGI